MNYKGECSYGTYLDTCPWLLGQSIIPLWNDSNSQPEAMNNCTEICNINRVTYIYTSALIIASSRVPEMVAHAFIANLQIDSKTLFFSQ